ncbi:MAG: hypothetical protein CMH57_00365 [Myxococcales bacterium]|nr:hypothetical protein [Myxococcales bacterium]
MVLAGLMLTALLTRPVERHKLPARLSEVRAELRALHQGPAPCVRWVDDEPLGDDEIDAFIADLETVVAADPRTVLPLLSHIRVTNDARALDHHGLPPDGEFTQVALKRLGALDQLRLRVRSDRLKELLPGLERFEARAGRLKRDRRRAAYLLDRLTADQRRRAEAVAERWRGRLAGDVAQASLVHAVASRVTHRRLELLAEALRSYHEAHDAYPVDIPTILGHLNQTHHGEIPRQLSRGVARDGALRDGWLRPLEYYRVGPDGYRITSRGPSEISHADDITLQGLAGAPARLLQK